MEYQKQGFDLLVTPLFGALSYALSLEAYIFL